MLELGVKFLISYFIGSLMGSIIVGRLRGGVDIRTMGSGNAGGSNAYRTQGLPFALAVIVIDIGKGVIGAGVVPGLELPFVPTDPEVSRTWLELCCGTAAVFGHVWPIYHRFRGGKGAATFMGTLLVINWSLIIPLVLIWAWVLVIYGLRWTGDDVCCRCIANMGRNHQSAHGAAVVHLLCGNGGLHCVLAPANIERMKAGTEHRNTRLMVFSSKRRAADDEQT